MDFQYDGDEEPELFYIGIGNLSETAGSRPLVYDWRAPVSGLFYDYDKGPAAYEAPSGIFEGEITSKWQYKIRNGQMLYEFESDVKIDDEILGAELGSKGEVQLKNIVRTIQKEQNTIIRNTSDKIMESRERQEAARPRLHCTGSHIFFIMTGRISSPQISWYFHQMVCLQIIFHIFFRNWVRRTSGR